MDDIDPLSRQLSAAVESWRSRKWPIGDVLLVGGSGLSVDLGEPIWGPTELAEVLPFASDAIVGHALSIEVMRAPSGGNVLFQRGRLHAYQGYSPAQVVFTVRLARLLGAHTLIVTNAAGGIYENARPGDLALIRDHINFTGLNPLRGALPPEWGPRFPDLSRAYDAGLRRRARELAAAQRLELREGVYAGLLGPSYETRRTGRRDRGSPPCCRSAALRPWRLLPGSGLPRFPNETRSGRATDRIPLRSPRRTDLCRA
jgi:purine-nucleoside phosphorylase